MTGQEELEKINAQVIRAYLYGLPGTLLLALGLYSLLAPDASELHPILGYSYKTYMMIGIGLIFEVFHLLKMMPLLKKQAEIEKETSKHITTPTS